MNMDFLFLWMIMAYGISNILVYGSIFNQPRAWISVLAMDEYTAFRPFWVFVNDMLKCIMCCSVWIGFFLGMLIFSPSENFFQLSPYVSWFFDGMFASGAVWTINSIVEWFEENRPVKN